MTKVIKIAIVEDSLPYVSLLSSAIKNSVDFKGIGVKIDSYVNPVDFKLGNKEYDVVILDYFFRNYTYGANGFYLSKFAKVKNPNTKVIINSSYKEEEVMEVIKEFKDYVDDYAHKEANMLEERGIIYILNRLAPEIIKYVEEK